MSLLGDAPKLIKDANCGISVEPNQPKKFAEAIRWMYTHPEECAKMGKNGRAFAAEHLSLEACTTLYEQLFKTLVKNN
jgi:colanic acid biosynthesis glycosyl transferase WcaI